MTQQTGNEPGEADRVPRHAAPEGAQRHHSSTCPAPPPPAWPTTPPPPLRTTRKKPSSRRHRRRSGVAVVVGASEEAESPSPWEVRGRTGNIEVAAGFDLPAGPTSFCLRRGAPRDPFYSVLGGCLRLRAVLWTGCGAVDK